MSERDDLVAARREAREAELAAEPVGGSLHGAAPSPIEHDRM